MANLSILMFIIGSTFAELMLVTLAPQQPLALAAQVVLGVLLTLVMPGYALYAAISPNDKNTLHRIVYSVALSLCIVVAGGLLLNWTLGMNAKSWVAVLCGVTLIASVFALVRALPHAYRPQDETISRKPTERFSVRQRVALGGGILLMLGAIQMATISATAQDQAGRFTQLWALPTASNTVEIGINNLEGQQIAYNVIVTDARNNPVAQWAAEVASGTKWETIYQVPAITANGQALNVLLYRQDNPMTIYRQAKYWTLSQADLYAINATATANAATAVSTLATPTASP